MTTEPSKIYSIHYNQCRKPWNCIGAGSKSGEFDKMAIPEDQVNLDHCMELLRIWHDARTDLESKLFELTKDESVKQGQIGDYKADFFQGHCNATGGAENYLRLAGKEETFRRIPELY